MIHFIQHWLGFQTGTGNNAQYLFWSGFFGDVAIFAAAISIIVHRNCHVKGCYRVWGVHDITGTPYKACKRHHPVVSSEEPITPATMELAHQRAADAGLVAHRDHDLDKYGGNND
jgi:hypothetical protein